MSEPEFHQHAVLLLVAIGSANKFSLKAHNTKETIHKHFPINIRKDQILYRKATDKKNYKFLNQQYLIYKKQTGGGTTWTLTKEGLFKAEEFLQEFL